jgi:DNA polymerase-3 subunit gamma/tau
MPVATLERAAPAVVTATPPITATATEAPTSPASPATIEAIRHAIGVALVEAGHESAAQLLGAGQWTLDGASLRIEAAIASKRMISLTINAAAEKIIRQELQRLGAPARFLIVPGESTGQQAGPAPMATPIAGSIQEAALANPLVQRAKEIFKADVRSVVDLRQK